MLLYSLLLLHVAGDLQFDDVSLRYFPGGSLALRHVDFHVKSCEKVKEQERPCRVH